MKRPPEINMIDVTKPALPRLRHQGCVTKVALPRLTDAFEARLIPNQAFEGSGEGSRIDRSGASRHEIVDARLHDFSENGYGGGLTLKQLGQAHGQSFVALGQPGM